MRDDLVRISREIVEGCAGARPAQTVILVGERGAGQLELAWDIARKLLGYTDLEAHPDFMRLSLDGEKEPSKKSIGVEQVRDVCARLRLSSISRGWRVLMVDRGDDLTTSSVNALLKTIEEPLPQTLILIVVDALSSIPATVRSRSRIVRVPRPDGETLRNRMVGRGVDPEQARAFLFLTDRDEELALRMMESGGMEIYDALGKILSDTPAGLSRSKVQAFVDKFGVEASIQSAAFLVKAYARHLVEAKLFEDEVWLPRHVGSLASKASLGQLLKTRELIERIDRDTAEQNLDKRYALFRSCLAFEHGFANSAG